MEVDRQENNTENYMCETFNTQTISSQKGIQMLGLKAA